MNRKLIENGALSSCYATRPRAAAGILRIGGILTTIAGALARLVCSSCQTEQGAPFPEQRTASSPVRLTPGDVIKLSFTATPDMNQTQRIRADGKVSLPLVGEVTAAGKTLGEFQSELIRLYEAQLKNAEVVVTLDSAVAQVVVSGARSE